MCTSVVEVVRAEGAGKGGGVRPRSNTGGSP